MFFADFVVAGDVGFVEIFEDSHGKSKVQHNEPIHRIHKWSTYNFLLGYVFKEIHVTILSSTEKYVILGSYSIFGLTPQSYGSFKFKTFVWEITTKPH